MAYYGIYIPVEKRNAIEEEPPYTYKNKDEAFKVLKKNRESRLKCFKTQEEAEYFSLHGRENSTGTPPGSSTDASNGVDSSENDPKGTSQSPLIGEKVSSFRGPTNQELIKFRKCIEQGNHQSVYETIWTNPRYLIGSGDTPTILKESFRYNALHVAALAKNSKMCTLILETVSDPKFVQLLHGKDNQKTADEVSQILLDLYLNMPEKGRGETPLHLATKFGAIDVVEVLTTYKECQMSANMEGYLPKDIICMRNESAGAEVVNKIKNLLQERFFVPVIRSNDNSVPPIIGDPFSPTQSILLINDPLSPEMEIKALAGPMNKEQAETFRKRWKTPPRITSSFTSPPNQSIGSSSPLSSYPSSFCRSKSTPVKSRLSSNPNSAPGTPTDKTPRRLFTSQDQSVNEFKCIKIEPVSPVRFDTSFQSGESSENEWNGIEKEHEVEIEFSGPKKNLFLNYRERLLTTRLNDSLDESLIGNTSSPGLNDSFVDSPGYKERNLKLADVDKGLEVIGRCLAKEQNVGWKEHWSFLGEFIDIGTSEGLAKLENYLQTKLAEKNKPATEMAPPKSILPNRVMSLVEASPVTSICRKFDKFQLTNLKISPNELQNEQKQPSSPTAFHAYICVEKSCQVFAKRLLKPIVQQSNNIVVINDTLICELGLLKSLVCSYKEDPRFFGIDFRATHARFAHIIVSLLHTNDPDAIGKKCVADFQNCLTQILNAKQKTTSNVSNNNSGSTSGNNLAEVISDKNQLSCLIQFLLKRLSDKENLIKPETLTTEMDCSDAWGAEEKCNCEWISTGNKNAKRSIKRKQALFSENCDNKLESQTNGNCDTTDDFDENDCYFSLSESEDDDDNSIAEYFTPPETPTQLFYDSFEGDSVLTYSNFIFGEEPTKMDNDVMKALHGIEIDGNAFPHVHKWYTALLNHSLEERNNFPPPLVNRRNLGYKDINAPNGKRLFQTPIRSPLIKRVTPFQLKPSILSTKFGE